MRDTVVFETIALTFSELKSNIQSDFKAPNLKVLFRVNTKIRLLQHKNALQHKALTSNIFVKINTLSLKNK